MANSGLLKKWIESSDRKIQELNDKLAQEKLSQMGISSSRITIREQRRLERIEEELKSTTEKRDSYVERLKEFESNTVQRTSDAQSTSTSSNDLRRKGLRPEDLFITIEEMIRITGFTESYLKRLLRDASLAEFGRSYLLSEFIGFFRSWSKVSNETWGKKIPYEKKMEMASQEIS